MLHRHGVPLAPGPGGKGLAVLEEIVEHLVHGREQMVVPALDPGGKQVRGNAVKDWKKIPPGTRVALGASQSENEEELVKQLGADVVLDTNFTADLTIMEEGSELVHRLQHGGRLPMMTSCSPGWKNRRDEP